LKNQAKANFYRSQAHACQKSFCCTSNTSATGLIFVFLGMTSFID
jgi:hypothetical protein